MNIHKFQPGQLITRIEPVFIKQKEYYDHNIGIAREQEPEPSFSFFGIECSFLGVVNGSINLVCEGRRYVLPLHHEFHTDWSEGWQEYTVIDVPNESPVIEKPVRDRNWLRIGVSMAFLGLMSGPILPGDVMKMDHILASLGLVGFGMVCLALYYRPRPDWEL